MVKNEKQKIHSDSKLKSLLLPFLPLAATYALWFTVSSLALVPGQLFPDLKFLLPVSVPVSFLLFIMLASFLTQAFIIQEKYFFKNSSAMRCLLLLFTIGLGAGLFIVGRQAGTSVNFVFILATANLIVFANVIGTWIVTPLSRPAELVSVCVVMSLADILSLLAGPTKNIKGIIEKFYESGMEGAAPLADILVLKFAVPGLKNPVPVFGVADWIIVAFLAASVARFEMDDNLVGISLSEMIKKRRLSFYVPVSAFGLMVAVLFAQVLDIFLPALPVIAVVFLIYLLTKYPQARILEKSDWRIILLFSTAMIGAGALIYSAF